MQYKPKSCCNCVFRHVSTNITAFLYILYFFADHNFKRDDGEEEEEEEEEDEEEEEEKEEMGEERG